MNIFKFEATIQARTVEEALQLLSWGGSPSGGAVQVKTVAQAQDEAPVEAPEPKKTQTRNKAATPAAPKVEKAEEPVFTELDVRNASKLLVDLNRKTEAKAIIESFPGVKKIADLKEEQYAEAIRLFKEAAEKEEE